jgi:hypothetical protein
VYNNNDDDDDDDAKDGDHVMMADTGNVRQIFVRFVIVLMTAYVSGCTHYVFVYTSKTNITRDVICEVWNQLRPL